MTSFTTALWNSLFPIAVSLVSLLLLLCFTEIPVINANSVDHDKNMVSDLGVHCLRVTLSGFSQLKSVKHYISHTKSSHVKSCQMVLLRILSRFSGTMGNTKFRILRTENIFKLEMRIPYYQSRFHLVLILEIKPDTPCQAEMCL